MYDLGNLLGLSYLIVSLFWLFITILMTQEYNSTGTFCW